MVSSFNDINIINVDQEHMLGRVHSIITGSVVDGPGIRLVIFLQGCQFKCLYCHNRDTWDLNAGSLFKVSELMDEVLSYSTFFDRANGGVTVTGGEPLLQAPFVSLFFKQLQRMGFHTCLDTNGFAKKSIYGATLDGLIEHTDLVMLDIKHINNKKHKLLTGIDNDTTLKFASYLHSKKQAARVRYVVVPGYSDDMDDIRRLIEFVKPMDNFQLIELLPYHRMGKKKWEELNEAYALDGIDPPTAEQMLAIKDMIQNEFDMKVLL